MPQCPPYAGIGQRFRRYLSLWLVRGVGTSQWPCFLGGVVPTVRTDRARRCRRWRFLTPAPPGRGNSCRSNRRVSASESLSPDPQVSRARGLRGVWSETPRSPLRRPPRSSVAAGLDGRDCERGGSDDGCSETHKCSEAPPDPAEPNPTGLEHEGEDAEYGVDTGGDQ